MLLFLDTEFTDLDVGELLSIGLVSEDGKYSFYAERNDYSRYACSAFVIKYVLPLFGRYPGAQCTINELNVRLRAFIEGLPEGAILCCDSQKDIDYFMRALTTDGRVPMPRILSLSHQIIRDMVHDPVFDKAFLAHFCDGREQHHALWDAQANRLGYIAATTKPYATLADLIERGR